MCVSARSQGVRRDPQGPGVPWWTQIQGHMATVGPWQYQCPRWVVPLPSTPGIPSRHHPTATRALRYRQAPAQRLADSVKTAITGIPIYHTDMRTRVQHGLCRHWRHLTPMPPCAVCWILTCIGGRY